MTGRLAAACARHPWRTIVAWVTAIAGALALTAGLLPGSLTGEGHVTSNPESVRASRIAEAHFPSSKGPTELVVVRSEQHLVGDRAFAAQVQRVVAAGKPWIARAVSWYETRDPSLVSADRHALLIPIALAGDPPKSAKGLIGVVGAQDGRNGFAVSITGQKTTDQDLGTLSQKDLEAGELRYGLPAALIVLALVFGSLVSAGLPLLLAIVSILVALGLTSIVAHGFQLSVFVVNMLIGMGLALGIDYALFIVSRFREERAAGRDRDEAIRIAGSTASRAVLFSGTAFVLAMVGLLLVESTVMRSLAAGAILVGIVSVVAALTLLPAVLRLLGDRVNALTIPLVGTGAARPGEQSRVFGSIVRTVMRRPALWLACTVALMLAAASPLLGMHIGAAGISTLPDSLASKQGYLALVRSFPRAGASPAYVVVRGEPAAMSAGVARLEQGLAGAPGFGHPTSELSADGQVTLVTVPVSADALSKQAQGNVLALRRTLVPAAFPAPTTAFVGGTPAENVDYTRTMDFWLPIVFVFVLGLSFLLLMVAFRSLVVSATAIVLNLLSVGAAYGLLVLVFQKGWLAGFLGFQQVDTIEPWVPLFLFAVLFGLSMDYQVFLLSRVRERFSATGDNEGAVGFGITSTARLITGAALIIVAVFSGFAAGQLVMFQQMGFGVAVALLIDATVVRTVLVPASMKLCGQRNWYLPRALDWLPRVEVEGPETRPYAPQRGVSPGSAGGGSLGGVDALPPEP